MEKSSGSRMTITFQPMLFGTDPNLALPMLTRAFVPVGRLNANAEYHNALVGPPGFEPGISAVLINASM